MTENQFFLQEKNGFKKQCKQIIMQEDERKVAVTDRIDQREGLTDRECIYANVVLWNLLFKHSRQRKKLYFIK